MSTASAPLSPWTARWGFLHRAHAIWNCLACHVIVDDTQATVQFTLAIPTLFTLVVTTPSFPFRKLTRWLAGGLGERAEYGFWHDYHETKLQWRRIIDLGNERAGWEWRVVHHHVKPMVTRKETVMSHLVASCGEYWIRKEAIDSWRLTLTSWRATSGSWWIPSLYDHFFTLTINVGEEKEEATLKSHDPKKMSPKEVFMTLAEKLHRPVVCQ